MRAAAGAFVPLPLACVPHRRTPTPDPYPAPTIALVSPTVNTAVPLDRPVVVFRLGGVASPDSADARSFRVWVDGEDRSRLFRIESVQGNAEAWGPLADSASAQGSSPDASPFVGVHLVTAQLCTIRGVCSTVHAPVTVLPSPVAGGLATADAPPLPSTASAAGPRTPLAVIPPTPQRNLLELLVLGLKKLWLH
jgi:hypothetical protein